MGSKLCGTPGRMILFHKIYFSGDRTKFAYIMSSIDVNVQMMGDGLESIRIIHLRNTQSTILAEKCFIS